MFVPLRVLVRPVLGLLAISMFCVSAADIIAQERSAPTAARLMQRAHDGRAVWLAFPGFTANITAATGDKQTAGTLSVTKDGSLELKLDQPDGMQWVERTLSSVVNHRLATDDAITNVEFADEQANHPLGRLIKSKDAAEHSLWRVKDDVLTEVHRINDKTRMIISVSDVSRNAEKKHLPHSYVVTTFDAATGAIQQTRQLTNEWVAIGSYDLPARLTAVVHKSDGSRTVEEIVLSNHKLGDAQVKVTDLAPLPSPVTSFGAAVADGYLYAYGGHLGTTHKYSSDDQSGQLLRLNLVQPSAWEIVAEGPKRTGLAMVAHKGKLYRIGGWEAKNKKGEEQELHSQADFARFDAKTGQWQSLPSLPSGRSSHDAAVLNGKLYVIGGWRMAGPGTEDWHSTALVCDISQEQPQWQEIAAPPFTRRALAVAAYEGKLYAIGGMDDSNDTTTAVSIFDPQSSAWTSGPKLPGKPIDGFGASAFGTAQGLFATTTTGVISRLADDGKSWVAVGKLNHPRMSHRLVAGEDGKLYVVGGTSRAGKVKEVERLEVAQK
jgi:N-acetylneuraminic acid mutarotase